MPYCSKQCPLCNEILDAVSLKNSGNFLCHAEKALLNFSDIFLGVHCDFQNYHGFR